MLCVRCRWTVCKSHVLHNATNTQHLHYFREQQLASQAMLERMERELCPTDAPTPPDYTPSYSIQRRQHERHSTADPSAAAAEANAVAAAAEEEAAEAGYQKRLHGLLAPYRAATRLHVTFAFLAKSDCVMGEGPHSACTLRAIRGLFSLRLY
jgi:hypothetical protein